MMLTRSLGFTPIMAIAQMTPELEEQITRYAAAQKAATITAASTQTSESGQTMTVLYAPKPWYKTWWGIGLIAAGAFGGYKLITR